MAVSINGTVVATLIPVGGIIMYSGALADIGDGWAVCDGENGTPNLIGQFVIGTATEDDIGNTGGSRDAVVVEHSHTATVSDPGHFHDLMQNNNTETGDKGIRVGDTDGSSGYGNRNCLSETTGISVSVGSEGESATDANLPPYYTLAYIMRIS